MSCTGGMHEHHEEPTIGHVIRLLNKLKAGLDAVICLKRTRRTGNADDLESKRSSLLSELQKLVQEILQKHSNFGAGNNYFVDGACQNTGTRPHDKLVKEAAALMQTTDLGCLEEQIGAKQDTCSQKFLEQAGEAAVGWEAFGTLPDGNCFFRACSLAKTKHQLYHLHIRLELLAHGVELFNELKDDALVGDTANDHSFVRLHKSDAEATPNTALIRYFYNLRQMAHNGAYSHPIIYKIAASYFCSTIVVFHPQTLLSCFKDPAVYNTYNVVVEPTNNSTAVPRSSGDCISLMHTISDTMNLRPDLLYLEAGENLDKFNHWVLLEHPQAKAFPVEALEGFTVQGHLAEEPPPDAELDGYPLPPASLPEAEYANLIDEGQPFNRFSQEYEYLQEAQEAREAEATPDEDEQLGGLVDMTGHHMVNNRFLVKGQEFENSTEFVDSLKVFSQRSGFVVAVAASDRQWYDALKKGAEKKPEKPEGQELYSIRMICSKGGTPRKKGPPPLDAAGNQTKKQRDRSSDKVGCEFMVFASYNKHSKTFSIRPTSKLKHTNGCCPSVDQRDRAIQKKTRGKARGVPLEALIELAGLFDAGCDTMQIRRVMKGKLPTRFWASTKWLINTRAYIKANGIDRLQKSLSQAERPLEDLFKIEAHELQEAVALYFREQLATQGVAVLGLLRHIAKKCPGFVYNFAVDQHQQLSAWMLMTARGRWMLEQYGYCLCIDAKEKGTNRSGWPFYAISLANPDGKHETAVYACLCWNTAAALKWMLHSVVVFAPKVVQLCKVVYVDKGICRRTVLELLVNAVALLCPFHIVDLNIMKRARMVGHSDVKALRWELWNAIVYESEEDRIMAFKASLPLRVEGGKMCQNLADYIDDQMKPGVLELWAGAWTMKHFSAGYFTNFLAEPPPIQPQQNIHTSLLNKKDFRHVVVQEFYSATQLATTTGCPPPQEGSHPVVLARVKLLSMNLEEKDGVFFVTKDALAEWGKAKKKDTAITNQLCGLFIGAPLKTKMGFD